MLINITPAPRSSSLPMQLLLGGDKQLLASINVIKKRGSLVAAAFNFASAALLTFLGIAMKCLL